MQQNVGRKTRREETIRKDIGEDGRIILKLILQKQFGKVWVGFIWLKIEISDGNL
jgi:hypothetical protein